MIEFIKYLQTIPGDRLLAYFLLFDGILISVTVAITEIIIAIKKKIK